MSLPERLRSFVKSVFRRSRVEDEMESELRFHLESLAADLEATGLSPALAMRQARIEFGPVATHKDAMRRSLGLRLFDELYGDLRYAARMLRRSPGFTAVAVGSLALGIGANTIIFTLAKGVLFDRLAVARPVELRRLTLQLGKDSVVHRIWGNFNPDGRGLTRTDSISYPVYQLLQQQNRAKPVLGNLFAFKDLGEGRRMTLSIDGHSDVATGQLVSGNYYEQLGVRAALGRTIEPSDDATPRAGAVAVISDELWGRQFGRSPSVIGKTIELNLIPVTIVGVNPPGFTGAASVQLSPEVFVPLSMQPVLVPFQGASLLSDKETWWVQVMGRVLPGVAESTASAALRVWLDQDVRGTMKVGKDEKVPSLVLADGSQGNASGKRRYASAIYVLLTLSGFVLLLACANLANLLLARSAARQRELAVRMAMGASRLRVMRQVLTESLLLACLGGVAGLLLGYAGRDVIPHLLSSSWEPAPMTTRFDLRIFGFTAAVTMLTGILFGLAPAWQATRTEVNAGLKDSATTTTRRRKGLAGRSLVVLQVALSMLLVVGAGLFTRTLVNLNKTHLGFEPGGVLLFELQAPESRYPAPKDVMVHGRIEEQIAETPGVRSVALSEESLLSNSMSNTDFHPTDQPKRTGDDGTSYVNGVGRNFFKTYGIPMLYGRGFVATDTSVSPLVAVVNQTIVRHFYGGINPVGKTFQGDSKHIYEIVGVCGDAKYSNLHDEVPPTFYILYNQSGEDSVMTYAVKTGIPMEDLLPQLIKSVGMVDRDMPLRDIRTQQEQIDATITQERLFAALTSAFGVLALTLACIGIYGIMAYNVARRTNEIGVRMALGARAGQVLGMVLRESVWMAAIGIAVGLAGAYGLTRFVSAMLFGLKPMDVATLAGAGLILFGVALAAGFGPARRASRIDPMVALRHE